MHPCDLTLPAGGTCTETVDDARLLCPPHWRAVPRPLQHAVYRAWADGAVPDPVAHARACRLARQAAERALVG